MARRMTMSVCAVLALCAATSSAAQASIAQSARPDDRAGIHGVGLARTQQSTATRPDDRPGIRAVSQVGTQPELAATRPDDRPVARVLVAPSPVVGTVATSTAFQWADAATGAGVTLAAVAFAGALIGFALRRRGRFTATSSP
jgi:hypothetical protein